MLRARILAAPFSAWLPGAAWVHAVPATVLFLATLLVGVTTTRAETPQPAILFFGDSLSAGYGLENPAADAFPRLVQQKVDAAHLPYRVINAGLSGETSAGGLHRIDWVLRQPVAVFFLELGANDGLRGIDPDVTERNLLEIIARVRAKQPKAKIVVAGMKMPGSMGETFTTRFDATFAKVAEQTNAVLMPFLLEGVAGHPDLNQADGIHPNADGARIVADHVWRVLRPLL